MDIRDLKRGDEMKVIRNNVTRECVVIGTCDAGAYVVPRWRSHKNAFLVKEEEVVSVEVH